MTDELPGHDFIKGF